MVTVHVCSDYGLGQVFPTPVLQSPTWALVLCYPNTSVKPDATLASASPRQVLPQYLLVQDPDQVCWTLTQCYLNTGLTKTTKTTSFLVSVMGWSWYSFTRWQAPSILALVGVSPSGAVLGYSKNYWGFRVLAPFTPPLLKCNCQRMYYDNWTKNFPKRLSRKEVWGDTSTVLCIIYYLVLWAFIKEHSWH